MVERDPRTEAIIGAAMDVHNELGPGFLESVYQDALVMELADRGIPFEREVLMTVHYKGSRLDAAFRADLICHGDIVVELKAIKALTKADEAQLFNYLKALDIRLGLLINFGTPRLEVRRRVLGW